MHLLGSKKGETAAEYKKQHCGEIMEMLVLAKDFAAEL